MVSRALGTGTAFLPSSPAGSGPPAISDRAPFAAAVRHHQPAVWTSAGDAFLYEVARYLDGLCRQARAFRFGNVEFAVVFPWRGETEATDNLQKLRSGFQRNWRLGEVETRPHRPLCRADLYRPELESDPDHRGLGIWSPAGQGRAGRYRPIQRADRRPAGKERMLVNIMRRSVLERRFQVWYQPIYDCQSGAFTSAEALLRLQDYEGNMISPAGLFRWPRRTGLIGELSWIVLEGACRLLGSGRAPDLRSVSINLSMQQFAEQELISTLWTAWTGTACPMTGSRWRSRNGCCSRIWTGCGPPWPRWRPGISILLG